MYIYFAFSALFNAVVSTILGIFIFLKNTKSEVNRAFAYFCIAVAAWSYFYIGWPLSKTAAETLLWFQLLHIGACFTPITYFHFVVNWLELSRQKKKFVYFGYFLAVFFSSFVFSSYFIADIVPKFSMRYWAEPGILYHFYLLYFFGYVVFSSVLLYRNYKITSGIKKHQIKYILIGIALSFVGGSTNYLLFYGINIPPYGNIFASSFVIFTAYAIVVHRLMDIKFVLRKSYVYLTSLSSIVIIVIAIKYISELYSPEISTQADFIILILAILAFPSIKNYFYRLGNKYFFSSLYDSREVISEISDNLRTTLEVRRIYDFIYRALNNAFHFKAFGVLGYNEEKGYYTAQYNRNFKLAGQKKFLENKDLHKMFISRNEAIVVEEIKSTYYNRKTKATIDLLESLNVDILVPLNVKDETIGLLILGPKESGDMYNDEDLRVLKTISAQAAIAIENALLYEETLNFTVKLKKEVAKATQDLKVANEGLKKLDEAKSDFISIASHQLRTPLTVIKGYISMMLEGSFGKLSPSERGSLEKVYESGERLIRLVENLLNISRIESGHLQFNYEVMRIEEIVGSVIEELANPIKKKGLRLNYNKPPKLLPKLKIDEEKIRQVIMNLVDNAVKYTKKGSITVSLKKVDKNIQFCVSDSGMGIEEEDLPSLFKKFSRGQRTSTIHTEGTGLGLYVAKEMVEAHKGKIWAESKGRGKGSKFCFEIPVKS